MMRPAYLVLLLGLVIAACSSGESADAVRPFTDIAVEGPIIEFDPSGRAATLRVTTNLDAVCAVAYGVDGPSGAIATDQDMGMGGHSGHSALMTGLEPGTTYQYRLQGVGSDGNIYRSETMTFTTPDGSEAADYGQNVALGATVVATSSEFSDSFSGSNAVDGDLGTEWSTQGDGDDAFITIDLGQTYAISALTFRTRAMSDGSATTKTFVVDVDGDTFGPFSAGTSPVEVDFTGQVLTFSVDSSTGGNTGAVEIEVYSGGSGNS